MTEIIDVTLRESVYYGNGLNNDDALKYLQLLKDNISNEWIQFVEIGYINNDRTVPLNYDETYFTRAIDICANVYKVTAMMHIPKSDIGKWDPEIIRKLSLVRIVVGQHVPDELKTYVDYFHSLGVSVSTNLTYVAGLPDRVIAEEMNRAAALGVDYFFCADSSGSFTPAVTARICNLLSENRRHMKVGIHLHDHMQMALANTLIAGMNGITLTDVSVSGAGKGGGNLKMEQALLTLYGKEAVSMALLSGLYRMITWFSETIGRDADIYIRYLTDFLTGLFRLSLKATDELERTCGNDPEKYMSMVLERYSPLDPE